MKESSSDPRRVSLDRGETWCITLPGLGSAGYVWEHTIEGPDDVMHLDRELARKPELPPAGSEPPATFSRDEVFTVTGLRPGRVKVVFVQKRPWEADKPPLRELVVDIEVGKEPG